MVNPISSPHFSFPSPPKLTKLFRGRSFLPKHAEEEDERDARNLRTTEKSEERTDATSSLSPRRREHSGSSLSSQYVGSALIESGVRCQSQGDYQKALKHFDAALKMQRLNIRSSDHISVAHTLGNIGAVQLQHGEVAQAKIMLKEAARMKLRLRKRNASDPNLIIVSDTLMNLGNVASLQGESKDAMRYYIEACKEIRSQQPTIITRQALADVLYNISRLHLLNHDWEAAMSAVKECHGILSQIHGDDAAESVDSINLTGFIQLCSLSFAAAAESFTKALWINIRFYGPNHPEVAASWFNIATVRAARGDLKDALMACDTSREMYNQAGLQHHHELAELEKLERKIKDHSKK